MRNDARVDRLVKMAHDHMRMTNSNQFIPLDRDTDGRSSCAKAIKAQLLKGPKDEVARHFSEAEINRMLVTNRERAEKRAQMAHSEGSLHLSLDNPHGDLLRKGGAPKARAFETIRAIHAHGRNRLAKDAAADIMQAVARDHTKPAAAVGQRRVGQCARG